MSGPQFNVQPIPSGGFVQSFQLKVGPGRLHWIFPYNQNVATRYIQVFDASALPNDGANWLWMFPLGATSAPQKELAFPPDGMIFQNGLWVCVSSTPGIKTLAAADMSFTAGIS